MSSAFNPIQKCNRCEVKTIGITASAKAKMQEDLTPILVHFRRPHDYDGSYGFDWLQPEFENYVSSFRLRNEYNPTRLLGQNYLTPWLSLARGKTAKVNLVIENLSDAVSLSKRNIIKLPPQAGIRFEPAEIRAKDITENVRHFPTGEEKGIEVEITCDSDISSDTTVYIYNQDDKVIGQLSLLKNDEELVMPIRVVLLVREGFELNDELLLERYMTYDDDFFGCSSISECMDRLETHMNTYAYNQAFIRCKMERDSNRQIIKHHITINETEWRKKNRIDANGRIRHTRDRIGSSSLVNEFLDIYRRQIESKTGFFRGVVLMITHFDSKREEGVFIRGQGNLNVIDARNCILFNRGLTRIGTYIHEIGHVLSLAHPFELWDSSVIRRNELWRVQRSQNLANLSSDPQAQRDYWLRHRDNYKMVNRMSWLYNRNRYTFMEENNETPLRYETKMYMDYVRGRQRDERKFFTQRQWRTIREAVERFFSKR